jgi:hypothetical protein
MRRRFRQSGKSLSAKVRSHARPARAKRRPLNAPRRPGSRPSDVEGLPLSGLATRDGFGEKLLQAVKVGFEHPLSAVDVLARFVDLAAGAGEVCLLNFQARVIGALPITFSVDAGLASNDGRYSTSSHETFGAYLNPRLWLQLSQPMPSLSPSNL